MSEDYFRAWPTRSVPSVIYATSPGKSVPVVFTWKDASGADHHGSGNTADISSMGVFVVCEQAVPPVLSPVSLQVLVPSLAARGKRLESAGTVVRVQEKPAYGFAAATTEFQVAGGKEEVQ